MNAVLESPPLNQSAILTARLMLRPLEISDAPWISRESSKPDVARMVALVPEPNPVPGVELFILSTRARGSDYVRAVIHRETGAPLGVIGAGARGQGEYTFGYWYAPSAWGQGYATEAGAGLIDALKADGARRFSAGYFSDNPASARVLEKLGFEHTGAEGPQFCMALLKPRHHREMVLEVAH